MTMSNRWLLPSLSLCALLGCADAESDDSENSGKSSSSSEEEAKAKSEESEKVAAKDTDTAKPKDEEDTYKDYPDPRGKCDLKTDFANDDACILPPDPSEGF